MHTTVVAIVSLLVAALSVIGITLPKEWVLIAVLILVASIGVPHGGLDHWTGRMLLSKQFPRTWMLLFFPGYLAIAAAAVCGWMLLPLLTAIGFFIASAWHFGLDDDRRPLSHPALDTLHAIAIGGLVIWIPVLARSEEVESALATIIPGELGLSAVAILAVMKPLSCFFGILAIGAIVRDCLLNHWSAVVRNVGFLAIFMMANTILAFGIYFCGWHSLRGLKRLALEHQLTWGQLVAATIPLTVGAIVLSAAGMAYWSEGQNVPESLNRTLFIALSAMAVPHLVLHGPLKRLLSTMGRREITPGSPLEALR
ncbi:MAG: Brp/Blh family beta-carotene 15,15'-dioxygenase [Planctomycetota bacterium]